MLEEPESYSPPLRIVPVDLWACGAACAINPGEQRSTVNPGDAGNLSIGLSLGVAFGRLADGVRAAANQPTARNNQHVDQRLRIDTN